MHSGHASSGAFAPQVQTFLAVDPVGLLVIDQPALTPQQDMDAARAVANAYSGNIADPLPFRTIVTRVRAIKIGALPQLNDSGSTANADAVRVDQEVGQLAFASRLHSFFWMTSCSICLSRLRSATMRLSRAFSSSSCFKRRSSLTPRPQYFFFQL